MDDATPIDLDTWPRRRHFEHYLRTVRCTYAMTVEIDVTEFVAAIRASGRRTYIAQIWAIASVVNRHTEFRMALTGDDAPAVWPVVHPSFTVFHPDTETFSSVSVGFDPDFASFHDAAARVIADHAGSAELFPQGPPPPNSFDVSSLPWTDFTGFNLNVDGGGTHLAPIFTLGRYRERDGRMLLPVAVQVHHAAADGFHTARLVNELRDLFADTSWLAA
ncbi:type A chloramphenicol O-acetyltransferase [Microbacterium sp. AG238]|uniref:type A chloramphenicol O-acetyltransferase n=1 Tax=Microbacterium sp. AG238 TaxID=2183994 RepID=UPI000E72FB61|nr:type A chloramphenicol O-acetyltransferase [Microbacterium sp. AG238]RKE64884.1 chloramphenicol O-acetyltransferase type A [Microbacterium sp. AG238]